MYTLQRGAILLIRVSDPKQEKEGLSLDNQQQTLRRYTEETGLKIIKEFRFQESADLKVRKKFQEMIDFVRKHPSVTAIVGYRVDRMTRNFHDHVLLDELRLHHGKELHFVHDRLVITPTTVGRDIQDWDTKVYLAKMYLNRLKEDAIASAAFKLSRGEWPGMALFGYLNTKVNGRSWIEPDKINAPIVIFCHERYATGAFSMEQLRAMVKNEFGVSLSKGRLDFILKKRFYAGDMVYNGKIYPHVYKALISKDLFDRTQAVKQSFKKQPKKFAGIPFFYRGIIRCAECGCMITPEFKRKKGGQVYTYYHCTEYHRKHGASWIREEDLTEQFRKILNGLRIPKEECSKIVSTLQKSHDEKREYATKERSHLRAERDKYQRRIEVLYEDRLDNMVTKEYYAEKRSAYESEIRDIGQKLAQVDRTDEEYYQTTTEIVELCSRASDLFEELDHDERRMMLNLLLQNCEFKEKKLLWKLKSPFDTVFQHVDRLEWLPLTDAFIHKRLQLDVSLDALHATIALIERKKTDQAA